MGDAPNATSLHCCLSANGRRSRADRSAELCRQPDRRLVRLAPGFHRMPGDDSLSHNHVAVLLFDLAAILFLARLFGLLARRLGQPPVVGEIVAGVVIGPTLFHGALSDALVSTEVRPLLGALANLGVALFMFQLGMELDLDRLRGTRRVAFTVSVTSMALTFGLGALLGLYLFEHHPSDSRLVFVLFTGTAMSVTAFPVLARILFDRDMHRTPLGELALSCAALCDVTAWSALAVIMGMARDDGRPEWIAVLSVPFVAGCVFVIRPLLEKLVARRRSGGVSGSGWLVIGLVGLLLSGAFTEWIGLHFIFGAFLFGTVIPRGDGGDIRKALHTQVAGPSSFLLLPVYFVVAGTNVNLSALGLGDLGDFVLIMLVAVCGKFGGTFLAARLSRMDSRQSAALAALMNTRGLTELVILTAGVQLGVLERDLYSLMVVMALLTTAMTGPLLRLLYPSTQEPHLSDVATRRVVRRG
ncbi:cation:proton antiporter [Streptomyces sp. NPDC005393]|uniref:cation:proton antiporter n=1 Tax=Streptomyces sp. NPDC005393 TaxID=3157041 RepID=UPI0033A3B44D